MGHKQGKRTRSHAKARPAEENKCKKGARPNQPSILQLWNSSKTSTSEGSQGSDVPTITVELLESEDMAIDITEEVNEGQSEGTRPPTSDEDNGNSSPLRSAPLSYLNGRQSKVPPSSNKLFPIFFGGKDSISTLKSGNEQSVTSSSPSRSTLKPNKRQRRSQGLERTKSAPSYPTQQDVDASLPLSQPVSPSHLQGKVVIEIDADNDGSHIKHGSRDEPITIDMSPVKVKGKEKSESFNKFFAPRRHVTPLGANKPNKISVHQQYAPWPSNNFQHIRGPQQSFHPSSLDFARAFFDPTEEELQLSLNFLHQSTSKSPCLSHVQYHPSPSTVTRPEASHQLAAAMKEHLDRASLSRFSTTTFDDLRSPQETWNERWHPRCAAEVIGNEDHARYLRDWLRALEVRATPQSAEGPTTSDMFSSKRGKGRKVAKDYPKEVKRPNIIRAVDKSQRKRRRIDSDEEDIEDWIADDDSDDENPWRHATPIIEEPEDIPDPSEGGGSPWKPRMTRLKRNWKDDQDSELTLDIPLLDAPVREDPTYDFTSYLTNTILLSGPSGCGKTAAVYACAEELGWEVFEVYPGIGKRNGASLLSLVGDAGKHHLVGKGSTRSVRNEDAHQKNGITSFFSTKGSRAHSIFSSNTSAEGNEPSSPGSLITLEHSLPSEETSSLTNNESDSAQMLNRQSIILLEEVDILFNEDVNFWPTIVTLIKESRRPVVMTCNDPSTIPFSELPLQTVLYFSPCPPDLASSYIKCLALAEGYNFSAEDCGLIVKSQSSPNGVDLSHDLDNAIRQLKPEPSTDLRRAINYTQFLCQGSLLRTEHHPQGGEPNFVHANRASNDDGYLSHCCDENPVSSAPDFEGPRNSESRESNTDKAGLHRLYCFSDALSMIDSNLERSAIAELEVYGVDENATGDDQAGYKHLIHQSAVSHFQGGIAFYNHDSAIVSEAIDCARRVAKNVTNPSGWHPSKPDRTEWRRLTSATRLQRERSAFFVSFSGALSDQISLIHAQPVEALVLDYAPWIRSIDVADELLEVAANKENETRALLLGGRTTRNSQRQKYERYLTLSVDQRQALENTAFRVTDTLPGVDHERAIREG